MKEAHKRRVGLDVERKKQRDRLWSVKNRQRIYEKRKENSKKPEIKQRERDYWKAWRMANPEKVKAAQKKYRLNNPRKTYNPNYYHKRKLVDPGYKILHVLRARLSSALREGGARKCQSTMGLIGCTCKELKAHIESQFKPGMTWSNHGFKGWHMDHIRPCCEFNLTDPLQQKICFHFTNIQPLWWHENLAKRHSDFTNTKQ